MAAEPTRCLANDIEVKWDRIIHFVWRELQAAFHESVADILKQ